MLIAAFTALAILLSSSNPMGSPFINPNAEKAVKNSIQDKERRAEALALIKSYTKEWKKVKKTVNKQTKNISNMNKSYSVTEKSLSQAFQTASDERIQLQGTFIEQRLKIQKLLTDEEWVKVIDEMVGKTITDKKLKSIDKAQSKLLLKQDKKIGGVREEIQNGFSSPKDRAQAEILLDKFEDDLIELVDVLNELNYNQMEVLRDQNAGRDELTDVGRRIEKHRMDVHHSFLELRSKLVGISTEKEWKKVGKALDKFF